MNLQQDLDRERSYWLREQPAPSSAVEVLAMEWLRASGAEGRALRVGERAPGFRLPDARGRRRSLDALLLEGPVVLLFYRGQWCPFCSLSLRAYSQAAARFAGLRASVVAISPQALADDSDEGLILLADQGSHVTRAYGLAYELPASLQGLFEHEYATPLPEINGDDSWSLPLTSVYLIGQSGIVLRADVELDYRRRSDPQDLIRWMAERAGLDRSGLAPA